MNFSLWTMIPRFPKLLQTAGRKCLPPPLSFSSGSNFLSLTFLFFCKLHVLPLKTWEDLLCEFQYSVLNLDDPLCQAQTDPPPVLPTAQERPFGRQTVLPWGDGSVPGSSGPADGMWRLHAWGCAPQITKHIEHNMHLVLHECDHLYVDLVVMVLKLGRADLHMF